MDDDLLGRISQASLRTASIAPKQTSRQTSTASFASVLETATRPQENVVSEGLQFSAHARARMATRGMALTAVDRDRIGQAVGAAANKGAKDAYICYGDIGLVVHVPNRTVVTAMAHAEQTVVTNVDSVVVVPRLDQSGGRGGGD